MSPTLQAARNAASSAADVARLGLSASTLPAHQAPKRVVQQEEDHVVLGEELRDSR